MSAQRLGGVGLREGAVFTVLFQSLFEIELLAFAEEREIPFVEQDGEAGHIETDADDGQPGLRHGIHLFCETGPSLARVCGLSMTDEAPCRRSMPPVPETLRGFAIPTGWPHNRRFLDTLRTRY